MHTYITHTYVSHMHIHSQSFVKMPIYIIGPSSHSARAIRVPSSINIFIYHCLRPLPVQDRSLPPFIYLYSIIFAFRPSIRVLSSNNIIHTHTHTYTHMHTILVHPISYEIIYHAHHFILCIHIYMLGLVVCASLVDCI